MLSIATCTLKHIFKEFTNSLQALYTPDECQILFFEFLQVRAGISKSVFYTQPDYALNTQICIILGQDIKRLIAGEPFQYVLGQVEFCNVTIRIDSRALIPRPETEELCFEIQKRFTSNGPILDLCTGSGCIAIALKHFFKLNDIYAGDCSDAALNLCNENAQRLGLSVNSFLFNLYELPVSFPHSFFDLIVSNPPYITPAEKSGLHARVLNFEPHLALFTPDPEGLEPYRQILKIAELHLNKNGILALELHSQTAAAVFKLIQDSRIFTSTELMHDLSGNIRFLFAHKI